MGERLWYVFFVLAVVVVVTAVLLSEAPKKEAQDAFLYQCMKERPNDSAAYWNCRVLWDLK